jgi:ABC-type branched-subunit amino acid transport system ATPase component
VGLVKEAFDPLGKPGFNKPWEPALYLAPPATIARLLSVVIRRHGMGKGVNLGNLGDSQALVLLAMQAGVIVGYGVLAWYIDQVRGAGTGSGGLPFTFPFSGAYWFPPSSTPRAMSQMGGGALAPGHPGAHGLFGDARATVQPDLGAELAHKGAAIQVSNLVKTFPMLLPNKKKGTKVAVDRLSLAVPRGTVMGVVGKNGHGKSTTINLLTGLMRADSGSAVVGGVPVTALTAAAVQRQLGVCPQDDVLWPHLTPYEHLRIIAEVRGVSVRRSDTANAGYSSSTGAVEQYLRQLLRDVYLQAKADQLTGRMSGGQKRKLGVAMALVGGPPIVVLDEPCVVSSSFLARPCLAATRCLDAWLVTDADACGM